MNAREEQVTRGFFDGNNGNDNDTNAGNRPGVFSVNVLDKTFNSAACIVSPIIDNSNPTCQSQGKASLGDKIYHYAYETNDGGTLKVTITRPDGGSCTYKKVEAEGKKIGKVLNEQAQKCFEEDK